MKKRMLPLLLALTMALSLVSAPALAADGMTYSPSSAPGAVTSPTVIDTGIPGMTLTVGADEWTYAAIGNIVSDSGVTYPGYIVGKANPKVGSGTGTYYSFAFDPSVAAGTLEIMYRLGGGKQFFILDNGTAMNGYDGAVIDQTANASATIIVQGGHTYTVYAQGSKLRLYGCTFKNVDPAREFADEIAAFSFDKIKATNADKDHVEENLNLLDSYESRFGSCDVNWTTSNAAVIANDGTVNCQKIETKVTLTGHFQVQENREFKADVVFDVTVSADPDDNSAVAKAAELCKSCTTNLEKVEAVYNYVVNSLTYDTNKAATVQKGYVPNVDSVLAAGTGICFDYAALMSAMLRSQGVPIKLVVGYVGGSTYHAWINCWDENGGWVDEVIYFDGKEWKLMDPTFASSGNQSEAIMQYIGNGTNYKVKFLY